MKTRVSYAFAAVVRSLALGSLALGACSTEKAAAPKACCEQPKIPGGVTPFVVVADEVSGPSDGQKVMMKVGLAQPAKRDAIYPVLHTLYRHAMTRTAFEPIHFEAAVYPDEASARAGGAPLALVKRAQSDVAPRCDNKVPFDFAEQVERAFAASTGRAVPEDSNDSCHLGERKVPKRVDDGFARKPSYKVDVARKAAEVTSPYVEMGKDEYVKELRYNAAMNDWSEYMTSMFARVPELKELTYIGVHQDEPVARITATREQYQSTLAGLQENIASHAAVTFANLGMGKKDDKAAMKDQEAFKSNTYKTALTALPKGQVSLSPKLKPSK